MKCFKIVGILICLFLSLFIPAYSAPTSTKNVKTDLESYYELLLKNDPYAVITSSFWDWRSVSYYRRNAGYHFGYDIALPAGFAVPSGWDGTVTNIIPWTNDEWGIAISLQNGYTVTLGHLKPLIYTGMKIKAGTLVGTVVRDHVDIKITNSNGNYVDFGKTKGLFPISPDIVYLSGNSTYLSKEDKEKIIKAKQRELATIRSSSSLFKEYLNEEKELLDEKKAEFEKKKQQYGNELISRTDLEKSEKDYKEQTKKATQLEKRYEAQQKQITDILKELKSYGAKETQQKIEQPKPEDSDQKKLAKAKAEADKYEDLYEQGIISRKEKEDKEKYYRRLKLEIMIKNVKDAQE